VLARASSNLPYPTYRQTYREQGDLISLLLFFQNKKNRLKITNYVPIPIIEK
jgi:hypothetical protein